VPYEMRTPVGKAALARRDTAAAVRDFDLAIERRLEELHASDPVLCTLMTSARRPRAACRITVSRLGAGAHRTGRSDPVATAAILTAESLLRG
jgi:hypothetical protein